MFHTQDTAPLILKVNRNMSKANTCFLYTGTVTHHIDESLFTVQWISLWYTVLKTVLLQRIAWIKGFSWNENYISFYLTVLITCYEVRVEAFTIKVKCNRARNVVGIKKGTRIEKEWSWRIEQWLSIVQLKYMGSQAGLRWCWMLTGDSWMFWTFLESSWM